MAGDRRLTITIGGSASGAIGALKDTEKATGGLGSKLGGFAKTAGVALAAGGVALAGFAVKCASTFATVGGEVNKLIRYTGATAEEASRLRFAGKQAGLGVDDMTKSLGILSKNLAGTKLDKLGLELKDVHGKALPLNDSLLKIADRIASMPNGAEKTALAMQLFGKSGAAMLPFLNKGAEGIAELEKQSDKLGNTLSQKDLDATKEATKNKRLFASAMEGLQIQVGRFVLPVMTKFATFMTTTVVACFPVVTAAARAVSPVFEFLMHAIDGAFTLVRRAVVDFVETWKHFEDGTTSGGVFLTIEKAAISLHRVFDVVRRGVVDFVETWKHFEDGATSSGNFGKIERAAITLRVAFNQVADFITANLQPILITLGAALLVLLSPVAAVVAALVLAYSRFDGFRAVVDGVVSFLVNQVVPLIATFATSVAASFADLVVAVQERWGAISEAVGHAVNLMRDVITPIINVIAALWRAWGDDLWNIVQATFSAIASTIQNVVQVVKGIIDVALALINGDWGRAWDGVKEIFSGVWNQIVNLVSLAINLVKSILGGVLSTIGQVWLGAWHGMLDAVTGVWSSISGAVSSGISTVVGYVSGLPGRIRSASAGMWDGIKEAFKAALNWIITKWNNLRFPEATFSIPHVPGTDIGGDVHIGGWNLPDIPTLHGGGEFRAPRRGGEGLALLRDRELVVTPEQRAAGRLRSGDQYNFEIHGPSAEEVRAQIEWAARTQRLLFRVAP